MILAKRGVTVNFKGMFFCSVVPLSDYLDTYDWAACRLVMANKRRQETAVFDSSVSARKK